MDKKQNKIFIIFGVSGSGQDSVIEGLIKKNFKAERVITTTTRKMRPGEKQGKPYYFVTKKRFEKFIQDKKLVEWDKHYGNYYGCTNNELERVKKTGKIILWKTDMKGALSIKRKFPEVVTIYIKPPSLKVTVERIKKRKKDSQKVINERIKEIKKYLKLENDKKFDNIVINKEKKLNETIQKVEKIIKKYINKK